MTSRGIRVYAHSDVVTIREPGRVDRVRVRRCFPINAIRAAWLHCEDLVRAHFRLVALGHESGALTVHYRLDYDNRFGDGPALTRLAARDHH